MCATIRSCQATEPGPGGATTTLGSSSAGGFAQATVSIAWNLTGRLREHRTHGLGRAGPQRYRRARDHLRTAPRRRPQLRTDGAGSLRRRTRAASPQALRDHSSVYQGSADVPRSRYTSPEFAALEAEYLWKHTWQFACREEDIPDKGDHVVYDVADESLIVTRAAGRLDQGVPQLVPPPRHEAAGGGRTGGVVPLPVPRLAVGPRRHAHRGAGRVGLPARHRRPDDELPARRPRWPPARGSCS